MNLRYCEDLITEAPGTVLPAANNETVLCSLGTLLVGEDGAKAPVTCANRPASDGTGPTCMWSELHNAPLPSQE